jgi:hypothetical protein
MLEYLAKSLLSDPATGSCCGREVPNWETWHSIDNSGEHVHVVLLSTDRHVIRNVGTVMVAGSGSGPEAIIQTTPREFVDNSSV